MNKILVMIVLVGIQVGCGYQVLRGDQVLGHAKLSIAPITEPSVIGITTALTRHIHTELLSQGLSIVDDDAESPLRLVIELKNPRTSTTVISSVDAGVALYQQSLTVVASLQEPVSGQTHWATKISARELFRQEADGNGDTALLTEAGRRRALDRLARLFALELSGRILVASLSKDEAN